MFRSSSIFYTLLTGCITLSMLGCSSSNPELSGPHGDNYVKVGSYVANYDATSGEVTYSLTDNPSSNTGSSSSLDPLFALSPTNNSAGVNDCAIQDTGKNPGDVDYCMGLIDPDSCSTDYNETTNVLSFFARIRNRSDLPNDSSPYLYTDTANFDVNTRYYKPFNFVITGIVPTGDPDDDLVQVVNTNLANADCGGNGLNLADSNDDSNFDGRFDCVFPEKAYDASYEGYPGWDFSPHVTGNYMDPGDDTGCVLFMQYTLDQNESFALFFDLLAVEDDGALPSTPVVTSHGNGDYVNTTTVTISGNSCNANTGEVYISGGATVVNSTCDGSGNFSMNVTLNTNSTNNLIIYQVEGIKQSGSSSLALIHDNIKPTALGSSPADGATSVDLNTNCVITFSEAMDNSTFTGTNLQLIRVSTSGNETGTITPSVDDTQVVIQPLSKPLVGSNQYDCNALTGVTDLAGNALTTSFSARFTTSGTGGFFQDKTPPRVDFMIPTDNTPSASPSAPFTIYFNEPIDPDTIVGSVVDPVCDISDEDVPTVFVFELNSCNGGGAQPIDGTVSLNAEGTIATFTPDNPADMETNNCYGFVVTSCVGDTAGNKLPSRGTRNIGAYNGGTISYNSYNVFFTGAGDAINPVLVNVGPILNTSNVHEKVLSHMIFSEAIDPATINANNFYITEQALPDHLPLKVTSDPSLQVVTFDTSSPMDASTAHVMTATGAIADFSGNMMAAPQTSNFTTNATADTTAPTIVKVSPDDGESIQDKCPYIDIFFSEPMNEISLNSSNIQLIRVKTGVTKPATLEISQNATRVRLIAESSLNHGNGTNNDWEISISQNVKDRAGNTLGSDASYIFEANRENDAPDVAAVVPAAAGSTSQNGSILVFFDEVMDKTTLTATNFTVTGCTPVVWADPSGEWAIANCINQMSTGAKTITVNQNVRDYYHRNNNQSCEANAGNRMTANVVSAFTVTAGDDTTKPTITNLSDVSPQDGTTSVSTNVAPSVTFSEAIDPRTVIPSSLFLMTREGKRIATELSISTDATTFTLTPVSPLANPGIYYIIATTAIRDLAGGNAYDGAGGETIAKTGVLRSCFSTNGTACP